MCVASHTLHNLIIYPLEDAASFCLAFHQKPMPADGRRHPQHRRPRHPAGMPVPSVLGPRFVTLCVLHGPGLECQPLGHRHRVCPMPRRAGSGRDARARALPLLAESSSRGICSVFKLTGNAALFPWSWNARAEEILGICWSRVLPQGQPDCIPGI